MVECCHQDMRWLMDIQTHSNCGCIYDTCKMKPVKSSSIIGLGTLRFFPTEKGLVGASGGRVIIV